MAFEPDVWLVQLIRRSSRLQGPDSAPVTVIPAGVAAEVALRKFNIARRARASNSLSGYGNSQTGGVLEEQVIPTFNLDFLLERLPRPNVVKCDVEGAEIEVFEGQMNMLRQVRPTVVCEVGEKAFPVITRLFRERGYVLFDGDKPLAGAQDAQAACWNTIAVPEERRAEVARG